MAYASPRGEVSALERFHANFVEYHSSPERKKFLLEFGSPAPSPRAAAPKLDVSTLSPRRLETTSQQQYQPYIGRPSGFAPPTKHNVRKAPDHELNETMFTLWNVTGKKPF